MLSSMDFRGNRMEAFMLKNIVEAGFSSIRKLTLQLQLVGQRCCRSFSERTLDAAA